MWNLGTKAVARAKAVLPIPHQTSPSLLSCGIAGLRHPTAKAKANMSSVGFGHIKMHRAYDIQDPRSCRGFPTMSTVSLTRKLQLRKTGAITWCPKDPNNMEVIDVRSIASFSDRVLKHGEAS